MREWAHAMETYRFGIVWRISSAFVVLLALAFPMLMAFNNEVFDPSIVLMLVAFGISGVWGYLYYANYSVTIAPDSVTVRRFARRPHVFKWHEVRAAWRGKNEIRFETTDHRKIAISFYFPGYAAVEDAARQHLSDVVFKRADRRPSVEVQIANPRNREFLANRRLWLRLSYGNVAGAVLFAVAALLADFAVERLDFGRTSRTDTVSLIYILKFAVSWGYRASMAFAFYATLTFIMYLQATVRFRRSPPAA